MRSTVVSTFSHIQTCPGKLSHTHTHAHTHTHTHTHAHTQNNTNHTLYPHLVCSLWLEDVAASQPRPPSTIKQHNAKQPPSTIKQHMKVRGPVFRLSISMCISARVQPPLRA